MIDLHCHILPDVDDGANSFNDSVEMARVAVSEGITQLVATPHHNTRHWDNPKKEVLGLVEELNVRLKDENINLTVSAGQEIRINGNLPNSIDNDEILFLDKGKNYLLIEFPTQSVPEYTEQLFYQLYEREITPIIAHPERNHAIFDNPDILYDLINGGALAQVTTSSYTGDLGRKIESFSKRLIEADLVHIIASDAHNITNRPFNMEKALNKLEQEYGSELRMVFEQNSNGVLEGRYIQATSPERIRKKRFFGLF